MNIEGRIFRAAALLCSAMTVLWALDFALTGWRTDALVFAALSFVVAVAAWGKMKEEMNASR